MSLNFFLSSLLRLGTFQRRLLLISVDALLLPLSVWLSFWLRTAQSLHPSFISSIWLAPSALILGILVYSFTGQYKGLTRYVGSFSLYRLAFRNCLLVGLLLLFGYSFDLPMPPRSSWLLLWIIFTGFTGLVRFTLRDVLLSLQGSSSSNPIRVAIYGAGAAGVQLAAALRLAGTHTVSLFVDDSPKLWGRDINGVVIQPPQLLQDKVSEFDQVLLAIPSLSRVDRRRITYNVQKLGITLLQVPSVDDITSGRTRIDSLRPIVIEELLGRDIVAPDSYLFGPGISGCSVCVTGAAGSIGSELCRQILSLRPSCLVLLEISEPSLYAISQELSEICPSSTQLISRLGNVCDYSFVLEVFSEFKVDTVFHAAAYKHVPLVESNPISGLFNNIFSTKVICSASCSSDVSQMVLVSTDKAVRPTNVMGASKRVAELIVQAYAFDQGESPATKFSMVRFGNVLGSSGSVVPLFRKQIAKGGPITLTHPEIIRYFMTIPEAAQLLLQSLVLGEGGDLFLLDMGEPVRIKDLAEQMVRLSGLSIKDASTPNGNIEIVCTGLRPGEKLYEELLIDAQSLPTKHPLIYRAQERSLHPSVLLPQLELLEIALSKRDLSTATSILSSLVPEWH